MLSWLARRSLWVMTNALLALALIGCASTAEPPPSSRHFTDLQLQRPAALPPPLPLNRPDAVHLECGGQEWLAFGQQAALQLVNYGEAANFNAALADRYVASLASVWDAQELLLVEAQMLEHSYNELGISWAVSEAERERLHRREAIYKWLTRALVGVLAYEGIRQ